MALPLTSRKKLVGLKSDCILALSPCAKTGLEEPMRKVNSVIAKVTEDSVFKIYAF
jgi:hypothetical protein